MADIALGTQQLDRFHHIVQVMRRFTHAHEDDFFDGAQGARQHHLRHDLAAGHLPYQAVAARHAELAADGAADLARHAQAIARQQHAFHRLAVVQPHQQARRTVGARMGAEQLEHALQLGIERRQGLAHGQRQEVFGAAPALVVRLALYPVAQHALFVQGLGAQGAQALAEVIDLHGF